MRLTAILVLFMLAGSLLSALPVVGAVLSMALMPFLTVAFMAATAWVQAGKTVRPGDVLALFRDTDSAVRLGLLKLGLAYAAFMLALLAASTVVDGGGVLRIYTGQQAPTPELVMGGRFLAAFWLVLLLGMLGSTLVWYAPGAVYWFRVPPMRAVFYSAVACVRNFGAIAMYMLAWGVIAVLAALVAMLLIQVLAVLGMPIALAASVYLLMMLMVTAALLTSVAFAFRDNFDAPGKNGLPLG